MSFLTRIFQKKETRVQAPVGSAIQKDQVAVYPMIKDGQWKPLPYAKHIPFVVQGDTTELAIVFAQDAGERFEYLTEDDLNNNDVRINFEKWQENIDNYPFDMEVSERLDGKVIFASGEDHSSEKILSKKFLTKACEILKTDKLLISIPRRRCLMITSYYDDFGSLQTFFHLHFIAWREDDYGNEPITEMVFIADSNKVQYAVPLGFRINLYEKDGEQLLTYSTMDDIFEENSQINFQAIMERNKIPVSFPG